MPPTEPQARHPFSNHLAEYLTRSELTLRGLEDRCIDPATGNQLNRTWLSSAAAGKTKKSPELWRLRALSAGIGTPVETLQRLAAEQWLSVQPEAAQVPMGDGDWVIVPVPPGMSEARRAKFVRWATQWAAELDADE